MWYLYNRMNETIHNIMLAASASKRKAKGLRRLTSISLNGVKLQYIDTVPRAIVLRWTLVFRSVSSSVVLVGRRDIFHPYRLTENCAVILLTSIFYVFMLIPGQTVALTISFRIRYCWHGYVQTYDMLWNFSLRMNALYYIWMHRYMVYVSVF